MTATTSTQAEPKVCAQTFASLASLAILIHFVHEMVVLVGEVPAVQAVIGGVLVAATLGVTVAWYRLGKATRRTMAVVLGALWAAAASEHLINVAGGSALDYTGLLTFTGGLVLIFAAYWDHHRPMEPTR
jgi:steroid 5-alpha reductase family enzyme